MNFDFKIPKKWLPYLYFGLLWLAVMAGQWLGLEKAKVNEQVVWSSGFQEGWTAGQQTPLQKMEGLVLCKLDHVQVNAELRTWEPVWDCGGANETR